MIRLIPLLILCSLPFSCEKEVFSEELPLLSDIIYGTWELREEINTIKYGDAEYHSTYTPYPLMIFSRTDSFVTIIDRGNPPIDTFEINLFEVNDVDSTITLGFQTYDIYGYSKDSLDFRWFTREGPAGRKLFKID